MAPINTPRADDSFVTATSGDQKTETKQEVVELDSSNGNDDEERTEKEESVIEASEDSDKEETNKQRRRVLL